MFNQLIGEDVERSGYGHVHLQDLFSGRCMCVGGGNKFSKGGSSKHCLYVHLRLRGLNPLLLFH
jgi:hypothetical protein